MRPSILTRKSSGTGAGNRTDDSASVDHTERSTPIAPPARPSRRLSSRTSRSNLPPVAPRASRTAISRRRFMACAKSRLATLNPAMASSRRTTIDRALRNSNAVLRSRGGNDPACSNTKRLPLSVCRIGGGESTGDGVQFRSDILASYTGTNAANDRQPVVLARIVRRQAGRKLGCHAEWNPELRVENLVDAVKSGRSNTRYSKSVSDRMMLTDHTLVTVEPVATAVRSQRPACCRPESKTLSHHHRHLSTGRSWAAPDPRHARFCAPLIEAGIRSKYAAQRRKYPGLFAQIRRIRAMWIAAAIAVVRNSDNKVLGCLLALDPETADDRR